MSEFGRLLGPWRTWDWTESACPDQQDSMKSTVHQTEGDCAGLARPPLARLVGRQAPQALGTREYESTMEPEDLTEESKNGVDHRDS